MGSRKKTIKGTRFNNLYSQKGNPKELYINRLVNSETGGLDIGDDRVDDELLKINIYFNKKNKIFKTKNADLDTFDIVACMDDSPTHSEDYTLVSFTSTDGNDTDIIRADYMGNRYDSSVTITDSARTTNGAGDTVIEYTLSNDYEGTVGVLDTDIKKIEYTYDGDTYYKYAFNIDYRLDGDGTLGYVFDRLKEDGDTEPDRVAKHNMYKYGTTQRSFDDAYENDELKDLYYTFCGRADDPAVMAFYSGLEFDDSQKVPTDAGNGIDLNLDNGDKINITVADGVPVMRYNGSVVKDEDDNNIIALPLEFFNRMNMVDKYIAVKKYLGLLSFSTKDIKLKWYQTGLFKFIIILVSAIYGIYTGDFSALYSVITATVVGGIFKDSAVFQAILILYAIYSLDFSALGSQSSMLAILNISSKIVTLYARQQTIGIREESEKLTKDENDLQDELASFKRQFLYSPLGEFSSVREIPYNAIYNSYSMLDTVNKKVHYGY